MFIGDALAMPVHWYYNRGALRRDYGRLTDFVAPRPIHPDSILWRSSYRAANPRGEILHEQSRYWGQRDVHYHQFLAAGENTLNLQLGAELLESVCAKSGYDHADYTRRYLAFLLEPGRHRDTYVEECHRNFFTRYAKGFDAEDCGEDDVHIGGLVNLAVLAVALREDPDHAHAAVQQHLALTHRGRIVSECARALTELLLRLLNGGDDARLAATGLIEGTRIGWLNHHALLGWLDRPDDVVIGTVLSPACYLEDAFPAVLHLARKHAADFEGGIVSNTNLGGDNCHRGAVLGAILGAALGESGIPPRWITGLHAHHRLRGLIDLLTG